MAHQITLRDESIPRSEPLQARLSVANRRLSAAELIAERARAECDRFLVDETGHALAPLAQPAERVARLKKSAPKSKISVEENHVAAALKSFDDHSYLLLVDDRQIERLDEMVDLKDGSVVTFLRLTPEI